jgi:DNA-binding XRE family transcriptional regulator
MTRKILMASKRLRFAQKRKATGFSQEAFADAVGVARTTVNRWECAETEPQPWQRPKIAAKLKISLADLDELLADVIEVAASESPDHITVDCTTEGTASVIAVDQDAGAETSTTVSLMVAGEIHRVVLSRRAVLEAASGSLVAPFAGGHEVRIPTRIDPGVVGHFAALRALLVDADNRLGGFCVLPTARQQLDIIAAFRRAARGELRDHLLSTQARWAEFVGWLSDDLGGQTAGTGWLAEAMDMAQEAADTELVAYLFARRAQRAAIGPDQDRVLGLASLATRAGGPPHVSAFSAVQRAHGHAIAGDERGFRTALDEARRLVDGRVATDGALGSFCTMPYLWAQEGEGWLRLRDTQAATGCLRRALAEWPASYLRERGLCLSRVAVAHLAAGEPDEAAHAAMDALQLAEVTQSRRIRQEVMTVGHKIGEFPSSPAVRALLAALPPALPDS